MYLFLERSFYRIFRYLIICQKMKIELVFKNDLTFKPFCLRKGDKCLSIPNR